MLGIGLEHERPAAPIKVVGLGLRRTLQRRAIDAFFGSSRRFFSEAWLDIIESE